MNREKERAQERERERHREIEDKMRCDEMRSDKGSDARYAGGDNDANIIPPERR